jgi:hypothetical protein
VSFAVQHRRGPDIRSMGLEVDGRQSYFRNTIGCAKGQVMGRRRIITAYQPGGPCDEGEARMEVGERSGRSWRRGEEQTRAEQKKAGMGAEPGPREAVSDRRARPEGS